MSESIPDSFNLRIRLLLYQRSKSIGSVIFNYKDTINEVKTSDWKLDDSICNCRNSVFCDPHHQHIVTGDLRIIKNRKLRDLLRKGPKYREPQRPNWSKFLVDVRQSLKSCILTWSSLEKTEVSCLNEWYVKVMENIKSNVQMLMKKRSVITRKRILLSSPYMKRILSNLHEEFVFVPTDKASNNIAVICKSFYIQQSLKELGLFTEPDDKNLGNETYVMIDKDVKSITDRHTKYLKTKIRCEQVPECLPFLYWIPKMHKKPYSKQRYIAASSRCSTKPLSATLTKCFKVIEKQHSFLCRRYFTQHGINPMWIIHNSTSVHKNIATLNRKKECNDIRTYDFSTLYTSIPHTLLKRHLSWVITTAFKSSKKSFISVYNNSAAWTNSPKKHSLHLNCKQVIQLTNWLINNIFVTFGDKVFRQIIGIPMGTDCAPFLANLFLYSYEYKWIDKQRKLGRSNRLRFFKYCSR